ncbi:MAG: ABC transporter permease, partial [Actinomycetota bacterium]|nr:ABC transporter permease [Actinomycetota bacterium]
MVLPIAVTAAVASATALGAAVALSRWFPVGLAGRLEPDRGVHTDWVVIGPGVALVAAVVLVGAAISGLRATSPSRGRSALRTWFALAPTLRRVAPLPAVIGAGLALDRGEGDRALPVRPALVSGIAAVVGVVGAFGLLRGIDDALARPDRSGQFWDVDVLPSEDLPMDDIVAAAASDDQVTDVSTVRLTELEFEGASAPVYALRPIKGSRTFTLLEGRGPVTAEEAVIGPATARALQKGIGDTVRVGEPEGRDLRVVGRGLLPQTPHFGFDQGFWMTLDGFDAVAPAESDAARAETVLVRFAPGLSGEAAVARLQERLGEHAEIQPSSLPADVAYLRNVRALPKALAGFLVLLGVGALGHVLATAVRRRRRDLAVLRAVGFRPLQVAGCVAWQAVTVSVVALALGIPLGI